MSTKTEIVKSYLSKYVKQVMGPPLNYDGIKIQKDFLALLQEYYIEKYSEIIASSIETAKSQKRKTLNKNDFEENKYEWPEVEIEPLSNEERIELLGKNRKTVILRDNEQGLLNQGRVKALVNQKEKFKTSKEFVEAYIEDVPNFVKYFTLRTLEQTIEDKKKTLTADTLRNIYESL